MPGQSRSPLHAPAAWDSLQALRSVSAACNTLDPGQASPHPLAAAQGGDTGKDQGNGRILAAQLKWLE